MPESTVLEQSGLEPAASAGDAADAARKLRILFLADAVFEDKEGGSRVVARELARGLAERGHEITFLVARHGPDAPGDERRPDARVVRYAGAGEGIGFVRSGRDACARLLKEQTFDVVHTHFAYAALGPLSVVPGSIPHVRTFHGPWDEEGWAEDTFHARGFASRVKAQLKKRFRQWVEDANLRRSGHVIVLSKYFRDHVAGRRTVAADRVTMVPGGVDLARFRPAADRMAVRQSLGLPDAGPLLFCVRRLAPRMGLDRLVNAMPRVLAVFPEATLVIGGRGPERAHLETLAQTLGLGDHVRFAGFIPDDKIVAHFQAADLFVLPTLALEGFGLVTVEALACGTPVLGTPVGATPEILSELDPRLVCADATPEALAAGILGFLGGGWAEDLTADRVRRFVEERYDWARHVRETEAIYLRACRAS